MIMLMIDFVKGRKSSFRGKYKSLNFLVNGSTGWMISTHCFSVVIALALYTGRAIKAIATGADGSLTSSDL